MRHRLLCAAAGLCTAFWGGLGCSSSSTSVAADAGKGVGDAHTVSHEGGIPDATRWEATIPDALLSISDAAPDIGVVNDPSNCVPPGTASNSAGVAGYCSPSGGQCNHAEPDAAPTVCTADFGAPAHLWFCTVACTSSALCGAGSVSCLAAAGGSVCVPGACAAFAGDASTESHDAGPTDAARADASVDAAHSKDASTDGG